MRVCIDPGHGGSDPGAMGVNGRPEKETNLRVAILVEQELKSRGIDVLLTRRDDRDVSLSERCQIANRWGADIFVSLHADAAGGPSAKGHHAIHSIHSKPGQGGNKLARLLVDQVTLVTGRQPFPRGDRGVWTRESEKHPGVDYYAVIRETDMPAAILERGFLTNPEEAALLFDDGFLRKQAQGIARAIMMYFGLKIEEVAAAMFKDIIGHWAQGNIEHLAQLGIVRGREDGTFAPDAPITRAEAAVIVGRAIEYVLAEVKKMIKEAA
ncbi:MAG: N-acetylmuramoyl-L-alanine amidase [Syntrophothermus sp.]|uniref:N-acetylmuramoyl-L-alanine amidase n=1 Tax=Syntrophothermus sp. TaxID=2736299 RepID=UPI00257FCF4E|nr:N-acetylmuramoyl-L-alanine amidase [Syntrophothermus sp.]NSW82507.1 N-acetylmuramoyl-L-alanine amidase [Syntrophothermus sp.]